MSPRPVSSLARLSLEVKLPILITALLLGVVLAIVGASYREVRHGAVTGTQERLKLVAEELATSAAEGVSRRGSLLAEVAAHPALIRFLETGDEASREGASRALRRLRSGSSDSLPLQLWSPSRVPVLDLAAARAEEPSQYSEWQAWATTAPDSGLSALFHARGHAYLWSVWPVRSGGVLRGYLAQLRAASRPNSDRFVDLLGQDFELRFANAAGGDWVGLEGGLLPAPEDFGGPGFGEYARAGEPRYLGYAAPIPGTPYLLVAEVPKDVVLARARAFLRGIAVVAFALILLGGIVARVVSRSVTRPLARLTDATREIAAGRYAQRVELDRSDELGRLAERFNDMAAQVEAAHEQLERQFDEASSLADELASANTRLTDAMATAERARNEAQKASRAKSEFLATMSHEMRTPINAMIGYTDLLDVGVAGPINERQRDQLGRIRASGKHLVGLVDEVLDLAGIESGRLRLESVTADLRDAVQTALAIVQPQADSKGLALSSTCACPPASSYAGDPRRVEQILLNVLSNAVKFTPPGGRIELRCGEVMDADGRWSEVVVADTGVGIPADQVELIFEPFVQVDTGYTRAHGGVGLGLAISRRLARMMGGELSARSVPGRGSVFTLRLPAGARAAA